jgi:hypothetical protein
MITTESPQIPKTGSAEKSGPPTPVTRKRRWFIWLLPFFSVLFVILILEIFVRLAELLPKRDWSNRQTILEKSENPLFNAIYTDQDRPKLGHENFFYPDIGFPIRDYHYSPQKPPNTFRILGTGDSFARGFGVQDFRYTLFKRLECWFEKENREKKIEIINGAHPAWATLDEAKFLREFGYDLNPDLIVVVFNLNDGAYFQKPEATMTLFDAWAQSNVQKRKNWLDRISKLYRWLDVRITRARLHNWTVQMYRISYLGPQQESQVQWNICKEALKKIAQECKKRNITLVVSIWPLLYSLEDKEYLFAKEVLVIEHFLKKQHILCHNLLPDFLGKKSESLWWLPQDSHPNERGHQIAAESLYRFLTEHGLVPPIKKS